MTKIDFLKNSPNTEHIIIQTLKENYSDWKLVQMIPTIANICSIVSPKKDNCFVFGISGAGKTVAQLLSVMVAAKNDYKVYAIRKGGFTLAGLAHLFDGAKDSERKKAKRQRFMESEVIFMEDLSDLSDYLVNQTVSVMTSFFDTKEIDYTTADIDANFSIGEYKTTVLGGTDGHYSNLLDSPAWRDKVRRRVIPMFLYFFKQEYEQKICEIKAMNDALMTERMSINLYNRRLFTELKFDKKSYESDLQRTKSLVKHDDSLNDLRNQAFGIMLRCTQDVGSSMYHVYSLAEGHAVFNNRDYLVDDDYNVIIKLYERFLLPFRRRDFSVFNYIIEKTDFPDIMTAKTLMRLGFDKTKYEIQQSPLLTLAYKQTDDGNTTQAVFLSDLFKRISMNWVKSLQEIKSNLGVESTNVVETKITGTRESSRLEELLGSETD